MITIAFQDNLGSYRVSAAGSSREGLRFGPTGIVASSAPSAPITLVGRLADGRVYLKQPLALLLEKDETGGYIISDSLFGVYGEGQNLQAALEDYKSALLDYAHLLFEGRDRAENAGRFESFSRYVGIVEPDRPWALI
jgi:hypothetical protein